MDVSEVQALTQTKKAGKLQSLSSVNVSISSETKKIGEWVEMLKAMPDVRDLGAPSAPDPKKIADAMARDLTN